MSFLTLFFLNSIFTVAAQTPPAIDNSQIEVRHRRPDSVDYDPNGPRARARGQVAGNQAGITVMEGAAEAAAFMADCKGKPPLIPPNPGSCQSILDIERAMVQAQGVVQPADTLRSAITARGFQGTPQQAIAKSMNTVAGFRNEITTTLKFTINPDGSLTSPDGTVTLPKNFISPGADLLSYGLTQQQINRLYGVVTNIAANGLNYGQINGGNPQSPASSSNGRQPASSADGQKILEALIQKESSALQTDGMLGSSEDIRPENLSNLSINFRGTPIGPSSGNVFMQINNAYGNAGLYDPR